MALGQQHYGSAMNARNLPGSWSSTGNSLEILAHSAKDALLVVDDFAPGGSTADVQRYHREADRLLRAQGNRSARQRLRSDATLRPAKPPRGMIVSTGEDVPRGQSLRARLLVSEVSPGDLNWEALTESQRAASEGLFAEAMAGYIQWIAGRYDEIHEHMHRRSLELRSQAHRSGRHRRTADIVARLGAAWATFLDFAASCGATTAQERAELWQRGWDALGEAAEAQSQHQAASEPTTRFLELLRSAISSKRAHVASTEGFEPSQPDAWGWQLRTTGSGDYERTIWEPQGPRVGWTKGQDLYLDPDAAFEAAQAAGQRGGDVLAITPTTLAKRLHERGLLKSIEESHSTLKIRVTAESKRVAVLHLGTPMLLQPAQLASFEPEPGQFSGRVWGPSRQKPAQKPAQLEAQAVSGEEVSGQFGQVGQFGEAYPPAPRADAADATDAVSQPLSGERQGLPNKPGKLAHAGDDADEVI